MELRHLRYFVAIADAGTLSRAAERVFVTQSTLSHQLAQLEGELGVKLFERIGRSLRMSDAGTELLRHARGAIEKVQEGQRAMAQIRNVATGDLQVGVTHSLVNRLIPHVADAFVNAHPAVQLRISHLPAMDIEAQVASGALHLGVAFHPTSDEAVLGEHLFDDDLALAVSWTHPLAGRDSLRFTELKDLPLALTSRSSVTRRILDSSFQRAGIEPRVVMEIDSVHALQHIAENGITAAFLSRRTTPPSDRLTLIRMTDPLPQRSVGLVWKRSTYRCAAAVAFSKALRLAVEESFRPE
ncbi:LysR substrate-binding domain-containing protein [Methylibium sp.]|uniref:LysR substrate-binding domain-containing protein n=1 Tax=Methylibium sp. TaxID=2067992 RepID=UPI003D0FB25F